MPTPNLPPIRPKRRAWNKGKVVGRKKPVRFVIAEGTRSFVTRWLGDRRAIGSEFLWLGRFHD